MNVKQLETFEKIPSDLLDEIQDYLDDHADAEYDPDGKPRGNAAMHLFSELTRIRKNTLDWRIIAGPKRILDAKKREEEEEANALRGEE